MCRIVFSWKPITRAVFRPLFLKSSKQSNDGLANRGSNRNNRGKQIHGKSRYPIGKRDMEGAVGELGTTAMSATLGFSRRNCTGGAGGRRRGRMFFGIVA